MPVSLYTSSLHRLVKGVLKDYIFGNFFVEGYRRTVASVDKWQPLSEWRKEDRKDTGHPIHQATGEMLRSFVYSVRDTSNEAVRYQVSNTKRGKEGSVASFLNQGGANKEGYVVPKRKMIGADSEILNSQIRGALKKDVGIKMRNYMSSLLRRTASNRAL